MASNQQGKDENISPPSLSQASGDDAKDGRFNVAEEQSFDQQSDAARRVGKMPEEAGQQSPADAVAQTLQQDGESKDKLKESIERAVPRGD